MHSGGGKEEIITFARLLQLVEPHLLPLGPVVIPYRVTLHPDPLLHSKTVDVDVEPFLDLFSARGPLTQLNSKQQDDEILMELRKLKEAQTLLDGCLEAAAEARKKIEQMQGVARDPWGKIVARALQYRREVRVGILNEITGWREIYV